MVTTSLILLAGVGSDLRTYRISNRLIAYGLAAGTGLWLCVPGDGTLRDLLAGTFLPVLLCWGLFRIRALGAGDIKLFAVTGCLNGAETALYSMLASFFFAAVYALVYLARSRQAAAAWADLTAYGRMLRQEKKLLPYPGGELQERRMHFSPAMLLGYCSVMAEVAIWGHIS